MLIGPERVCYMGLLGAPSLRSFGSLTLYCTPDHRPFRICLDGQRWQERRMALVHPYQPHSLATGGRMLGSILFEPETLALDRLSGVLDEFRAGTDAAVERMQRGYQVLQGRADREEGGALDVDRLFLGGTLPTRSMDPRIARVIEAIQHDPTRDHSAQECAALSDLSFSRFLHLFKQEVGITFRKFRAWKRARGLLYHVNRRATLTDIALDVGYPDSTHFSHSIRRVYGLKPKDILAGSRRLAILLQGAVRPPEARSVRV